jgi:glutaredoxin
MNLPFIDTCADYTIYGTLQCNYCIKAIHLLTQTNQKVTFVNTDHYKNSRYELTKRTNGYATIPVIYEKNKFIGGFSELKNIL